MRITPATAGGGAGPRREFLRFGLSAAGGLSLPGMLRSRAESQLGAAPKAVIAPIRAMKWVQSPSTING